MTPWNFEHSVECQADRNLAWYFWTNVSNWAIVDPSVEFASLDGPFQSGAKGTTKPRGGEPIQWRLEDVQEGRGAVVIVPVAGAALRCAWIFEDSATRRTRITQRAMIEGAKADDYVATVAPGLAKGIPQGMKKLAETIEQLALGAALGRWLGLF
jgi:hypothetical protein